MCGHWAFDSNCALVQEVHRNLIYPVTLFFFLSLSMYVLTTGPRNALRISLLCSHSLFKNLASGITVSFTKRKL